MRPVRAASAPPRERQRSCSDATSRLRTRVHTILVIATSSPRGAMVAELRRILAFPPNPDEPDWAVFPVEDDEGRPVAVSPRSLAAIYVGLSVVADQMYDEARERGDEPPDAEDPTSWFSRLPRISWRHQTELWRSMMARAADDLCSDIEMASGRFRGAMPRNWFSISLWTMQRA